MSMIDIFEIENKQGVVRGTISLKDKRKATLLYVHGFERFGLEPKFRNICNNTDYNWVCFDQTGIGVSEGIYGEHTLESFVDNLSNVVA